MTDFAADSVDSITGGTVTKRTATASSDTVPAGATVLWVNSGAGSHTVTLTSNNTYQGLAIPARIITVAAGGAYQSRIDPNAGDTNGRVPVAVNGTAAEITYYITNT